METTSDNVEQTIKFAQNFAKMVKSPCVILLRGDLGAGKTHFVKGFVKGIKAKEQVTSPTFTIMNIYNSGKFPIYHFDLYRLTGDDEAEELGFYDYFDHKKLDGISLVEWPENAPQLVKDYDFEVDIKKLDDENKRLIIVRGKE